MTNNTSLKTIQYQSRRIDQLEQQLAACKTEIKQCDNLRTMQFDAFTKQLTELQAQNLALLAAIEAKNFELRGWAEFNDHKRGCNCTLCEALAIQPSADLLAERDRVRDAKLLLAFGETSMADSVTLNSLKCYAAARIDGSWVPEL